MALSYFCLLAKDALSMELAMCFVYGVSSESYGMWAEGGKGKSTIVSLV